MVKNGQVSAIRQMTYRPADAAAAAVEVMSFETLRQLNDGGTQRADFHVIAIIDEGEGHATLDFERCRLSPRTAAWIPPGAVHRWDEIGAVTGSLILCVATAPVTDATRQLIAGPGPGRVWSVPEDEWGLLSAAVSHLRQEAGAALTATAPAEIPRILLSALLARLQPAPAAAGASCHTLFRRFQEAVETQFRRHHQVSHYARELGYAPRTLSRAVLDATGATAKAYITGRLILEAKRMLIHDRFTAARCATELGFRDASNFSGFFSTATGERPGRWQAANGG